LFILWHSCGVLMFSLILHISMAMQQEPIHWRYLP
jgi:hypothetical protein